MTKAVRIENADNSDYKVLVEVYEKGAGGQPDVLMDTFKADYPTTMVTAMIHSTRYLVVKEG
jgi:hypothetical protein